MGTQSSLGLLAVLLAVTTLVRAQNPFVPVTDTCSIKRCQEPAKFQYTPGEAYRYRYSANTASSVLGVSKRSTTLTLQCDVLLHVITPCEHAITIENVRLHTVAVDEGDLTDKDIESDSFTTPLEGYQLRYGFQDGVVDSVCPEQGDPTWSVNIKKGIISVLQNSQDRVDLDYADVERDVTGDCPTTYRVEGVEGAGIVITKVRDLNACVGRFAHTSHIQGVSYNIKSPVQNIPMVSSTSTCRQTVLARRIFSTTCEEKHQLNPFSTDQSGAVTVTAQNLTYIETTDANAAKDLVQHRETLLYNHLPAKSASHIREKSLGEAEALVQDLCKDDSEVRVDSTTQFSQLIDDLRGMTLTEITSLYRLSPSICRHGQQLIKDALPVVSTAASLELMRELILNGDVTPYVANTWLMALNFIPSVDEEMLRTVGGLLREKRPGVMTRAVLSVGAVVHQYCKQHDNCDTDSTALDIVERLAKPLGTECSASSDDKERKVLLTLRAVGNAGIGPPGVVRVLNDCLLRRQSPARVKVAAIEAFRRFDCSVPRDEMRLVFRDPEEDSEVRIAAYLGLMRCPSHQEIGNIREALEQEQVNQVGSFMWTHLMNLQETSSPYQLEVQGLLADLDLKEKFKVDTRRFSRNFEVSGFNSEYHVGASLDSNLVYSAKSYVPRSLSSNLTLQLFGESVNLLEVGARLEGLERYVESMFAPGDAAHDMEPESPMRARRAAKKTKLEKIKADFGAEERFGNPLASFNLKVFGHEVDNVDLRASDMQKLVSWASMNGPAELMSKLSNTESLDISRSVKFLEGTYIVPTGTGLPLNLTASAVAAVNVQMSGNAQLDKLIRNQELDVAFRLRPSGAVTFDGTMMIDGMAVQLGMGMKATMHSSTLIDTSLRMEGYKLVDARVNMPKDRMDLYNFESSLRFIHQDQQTALTAEITMEGDKHQQVSLNSCTGGEKIKGWRTCAHLMYVNASENTLAPHFPLTGPAKMGLYVEKTDKTMEGYKLEWRITDNRIEHNLRLLFDTPRSTINRRIELNLKRSKKHGRIGFRLKYPGDELTGKGETYWSDAKKGLKFELSRQGVEVLALNAQLQVQPGGIATVYRPTFIVNFLKNPYANLRGYVKVSDDGATLKREIELNLMTPFIRLGLSSSAEQTEELYNSSIVVRHTRGNDEERELRLQLEDVDREGGDGGRVGHWMAAIDFDISETIHAQWAARWDHKNSQAGSMNKIQTAVRPEDFNGNPTFAAGYAFDHIATEDSSRKRVKLEMQYPRASLDLLLSVDHDTRYRGMTNQITLRYAPGRELLSVLNVTGFPMTRGGTTQGSWQLSVPGYPQPLKLQGAVQQLPRELPSSPQEYTFVLEGSWLTGAEAQAEGRYASRLDMQAGVLDRSAIFNLTVDQQKLVDGLVRLTLSPSKVLVDLQIEHDSSGYGVTVEYDMVSDWPDFQRAMKLALTYPGASYSLGGTLQLGEEFRTSVDLSLNGQRDIMVVVSGKYMPPDPAAREWSPRALEWLVDVKWDANRDPSQRLSLDFKLVEPAAGNRNLTVVLVYPVNTVIFTMDREMSGDWHRLRYNNNVLLVFGASDPVEMTVAATTQLDSPVKTVEVDVNVNTPFPGWRNNIVALKHSRSRRSLDSQLEVVAGGERAKLVLSGDNQLPRSLQASGKLTSTVQRWNGQLGLDYAARQGAISSQLTLDTAASQYSATMALEDLSRPGQHWYRAQLNMTTPFQGMHDMSYSLGGKLRPGDLEVTGHSRVENIGHDLLITGSGWEQGQRMEGAVVLNQIHPLQNKLNVKLLVDPTEAGRAFKASVQWPDNRMALEGDAHFASPQDFGIGVQFLSPFAALKDAGLMVKHKRVGWKINSEARVAWLLDNPVALTLDADLSSLADFGLQTELNLPLERWSRLSAGIRNKVNYEARTVAAAVEGAVAEYKFAMAADGSLGVLPTDKRYGTVSFTLPGGEVERVTVAASVLSAREGLYEMFLSPVWHLRDSSVQEIRLTGTVDLSRLSVEGPGLVQAHLRLMTPWLDMVFLEVTHDQTAATAFVSTAVASYGQKSARLRLQLQETSDGYKFDAKTTSNIAMVPTISSVTTVSMGSIFRLNCIVQTPHEYLLTLATDMFAGGPPTLFDAQLTTPHREFDRISVSLKLAGDQRQRTLTALMTLPGYEQHISVTGTLQHMDLRLSFQTPFPGFRSGSLQMSAVVASGRFDPVFRLTWDRYVISMSGTSSVGSDQLPRRINGAVNLNLPIGPRISGNFELSARRGPNSLAYDLTLTSTVDNDNYDLRGEVLAGPKKYGLILESSSSDPRVQVSGSVVLSLQDVTGFTVMKIKLNTPHDPLRNITLNLEYRDSSSGHQLNAKLHHPQLKVEVLSRTQLASWMQFYIGADVTVKMGRVNIQRSLKAFHTPGPAGVDSKLGLQWQLPLPKALASWGKYAVLTEYQVTATAVKASLTAGREAGQDKLAPTDLRAGLDLTFDRTYAMARGVLTVHFGDGVYTLDTDYSARAPFSGGVRLTQRSRGVDWQLTARGKLTPSQDNWQLVLNLTLPVEGYKSVDAEAMLTPAPGVYTLKTHIDIDPQSSFYQHTKHQLDITGDITALPAVAGNFRYLHHDLDDDEDLLKLSGDLTTIYNRQDMGVDLSGEVDDGTYELTVRQSALANGRTGKVELTTSYPAIEDFLAEYKFERGGVEAIKTTFRSVYNQNALVDGTYTLTMGEAGTQRHFIDLDNPLHPFTGDMTLAATNNQYRVDARVTSQREEEQSITGWVEVTTQGQGSRKLDANLTLPWRTLGLEHSVSRTETGYERAARVTLSPEAFVGYKLNVNTDTDMRQERGGSARMQLDLPARSLAVYSLLAMTPRRRNNVFSSGRAQLTFQWDAERQPERQVGATIKIADLSTRGNMHYNVTLSADIVGKPASLETSVQRSLAQPLQLDAVLAYSTDRDSHMTLSYGVANQTRGRKSVLKSNLVLSHPVSRLSVTGKGQLETAPGVVKLSGSYTYLDIEDNTLKSTVQLDVDRKLGVFSGQMALPSMVYDVKSTSTLTDYRINGAAIPTEYGSPQTFSITMERNRPIVMLEALYDPEQAKRLYVGGGMLNNRTVRLEAYRQSGLYRVDDAVFFVRLNHSHLLTSQARWRTELAADLANWADLSAVAAREAIVDMTSSEWNVKTGAMESSFDDMFRQEIDILVDEFTSSQTGTVKGDYEDLNFALTESYDNDEFYSKTIMGFIYGEENSLVTTLLNKLEEWTETLMSELGIIGDTVYEKLNDLIEYLRSLVSSSREGEGSVADTLREVLTEMAEAYNQWAKRMWRIASLRIRQKYTEVMGYIQLRLMKLADMYRPHLLMLHHQIETNIVQVVRDAFRWWYGEFQQSELYQAVQWTIKALDQLYKDISERDAVTNFFDYSKKLINWISSTFGLQDVFGEPGLWLKEFWDNPPPLLAEAKQFLTICYYKITWVVNHLGIPAKIQSIITKIYYEGDKFWTQTALQGAQRYFDGKSIMVMRPHHGYISFIQVLPMPWYGLTQQPIWEELPELQKIQWLRDLTKGSDKSFSLHDLIYDYWPGHDPMEWLPPFKGHAVVSGSSTFVTFDGKLYTFHTNCSFLLAADLLADRFSVKAAFRERGSSIKTISVTAGRHTVQLGGSNAFRIVADGKVAEMPLSLGALRAVRSGDIITVTVPGWVELRCNQRSDVCGIQVSRWMFGRTGGLLGTLDNEPYTDMETPDHHQASLPFFAKSWAMSKCSAPGVISQPGIDNQLSSRPGAGAVGLSKPRRDGFCWGLLGSPRSDYRACHRLVDPAPFLAACQSQQAERRCISVAAYVEACQRRGWPLKMPNKCVQCNFQGKTLFEGRTVKVETKTPATEVVFIVEAKECNANMTIMRGMQRLLLGLHHALRNDGFATTRFAVVVFGGDGVQSQPQVMTVGGNIFSPYKKIIKAFHKIVPGTGNRDVFGALRRAAMLPFTPGVSRTFILMPCSACWAPGMSVDYTTLANAFAEQQITLHVLLDGVLKVSKRRNQLIGIDNDKAWTLKDAKNYRGDRALLKHVKTPKEALGLCEPLARKQTRGSIFAGGRLRPRINPKTGKLQIRTKVAKKLVSVFGQRVAQTARPRPCQLCECVADVEGTAKPVCLPCLPEFFQPTDPEDGAFFED